ncbi:DUF1311 domain-containing protein [Mucilaginibacter sp. BJC16-A38]|uniref:lysozyme inhibitor LprI family protein n=1 Tax=Mucilaginibacter phenanthrenivorans TaxID=1234842 RepID=UPI0021571AC4|nr:lysozyme inhibitor LprI family protein [Mucilaginibacter phenanthrenivorans]MCR8562022.1 DUF1311 domain-containing protein [Mucilaginibacter phenanthrenivorans]
MKKNILFIALFFISFNAVCQIKQDSTCSGASSKIEYYKCLSKQYINRDNQLNKVYKSVLDMLVNKKLLNSINALKESQRSWIVFRDKYRKVYEHLYTGGTMMPISVLECEIKTTNYRIEELNELYNDLNR